MNILITGGAGFIGSHLVKEAISQGNNVWVLDSLTYAGRLANLYNSGLIFNQFIKGDITNASQVEDAIEWSQPDVIIHLAAETHVDRSIECHQQFLTTNVSGTYCLLEQARKYWESKGNPDWFRFVHVSTDEVYGSLSTIDEDPWTEDSPYLPNNPYAASKAASDHIVRSYYQTYRFPAIITHSSNNYGEFQHPEKLIPTLIRQSLQSKPMTIHGNGENIRDWLHVADHCRGLLLAMNWGVNGQTYNFGGLTERSNIEIAVAISGSVQRMAGLKSEIVFVEDRPGNDFRYATNISKSCRDLKWEREDILNSFDSLVRWHMGNQGYEKSYGM